MADKTLAERVKELQLKGAMTRIAEGRAKPTDDLIVNPEKFTPLQAAEIRATEKSKGPGGYSYLNPNSRGQQLANDSFEATYGKNNYDNLYGVTYSGPSSGSESYAKQTGKAPDFTKQYGVFTTSSPDKGENETPEQFKLRYTEWERDEARRAFNQTVNITKGTRNYAEADYQKGITAAFADKASQISRETRVNPLYSNLSANQKVLNQQYFEKTGKYLVNPEIDVSSGRAPMAKGYMTKDEKLAQASFNAKMAAFQAKGKTPTQADFNPKEQVFFDAYSNYEQKGNAKKLQLDSDREGVGKLGDLLSDLKVQLGVTEGQELAFDSEGNPYIVADGTKYDPIARAKEKLETERQNFLSESKKNYDNARAAIEEQNTVNGELTIQGKRKLAELDRDYAKKLDEAEKTLEEKKDQTILNEQIEQKNIEKKVKEKLDPETLMKEQEQKEILKEAQSLITAGVVANYSSAIAQVKAMRKAEIKNPTEAETFKEIDKKIFVPGFERSRALDTAVSVLGYDAEKAKSYLKSRGFTDTDVAEQLAQYQTKVLGYTPEQIKKEKDDLKIQDVIQKPKEELTDDELDFLQEYQVEHPENAERWKMKLMFPDMSDADIYKAVKKKFEEPKKGRSTGGSSSNVSSGMYSEAKKALEKALGEGTISARNAKGFLRENYPKLKADDIDDISRDFVKYNSSTKDYDSLVSPYYEMKQNISDGESFQKMSPSEKANFLKYNEDTMKTGKFVDGVFIPNKEVTREQSPKSPREQDTKQTKTTDEFDALFEEALKELEGK